MKKRIVVLITLLLSILCFVFPVAASNVTLKINGAVIKSSVEPIIENGTTLVPLRTVSENMGASVKWNGDTRQVTIIKGSKEILLTIGSKIVIVNGESKELLLPPKIIENTTMVPIRFVSENLGANVKWNENTRTVEILSPLNIVRNFIEEQELTVTFLDVGQADSALLICGDEAILIDGGNVSDSQLIYTVLKNNGIDHLKAIVISHAHEDHCGGVAAALKACTVDTVYAPVATYDSKAFSNITNMTEIVIPTVGDTFYFGSAMVEILGPVKEYDNTNNTSVVCKVTNGNDSFLFTGDMEFEAEKDLVDSGADLSADVLKVGHHGSDTSTSYVFLREVMPSYAVISSGYGNSYGHPSEVVLSRLKDANVNVYRTDLQGDIVMKTCGDGITVSVQKNVDANTLIPGSNLKTTIIKNDISNEVYNETYVGNVNSKVFHLPTCKSLPTEKNRIYFYSRQEAIQANYRPCGNCNP